MYSHRMLPSAALALLALVAPHSQAALTQRWSFNTPAGAVANGTVFLDSVSSSPAVVRGQGATANGNSLILPGGTTGNQPDSSIAAYIDLPNGILSSRTSFTLEIWATPVSARNWQRLFDFGRTTQPGDGLGAAGEYTGATTPGGTSASDGVMLSFQRGGDLNTQRFEPMVDGAAVTLDTGLATTAGTQYHYVVTFEPGVGTFPAGGRFTWYRNAVAAGSTDVPFALSQIEDVNNWLGRSQWSGDAMANAAYNEVRLHDGALTAAEVAASYQAGPELGLVNRWSFNNTPGNVAASTTLADAVSGAPAVVRGVGAVFTGTAISLPGNTNGNRTNTAVAAYVDLPNGILSALNNATIEIWATPLASQTFQRLFDFGNSSAGDGLGAAGEWTGASTTAPGTTTASDEFGLTFNVGTDINTQRLYGRLDYNLTGGLNLYVDSNLATTIGTRYHYVVTYERGVGTYASTGGRESWYRDGVLVASLDLPYALSAINDVNNWLGRSQFAGDTLTRASYDEFRLYSFALTPAEVVASRNAGPDALVSVPAPVTVADSATLHRGQKVRLAVLANDTGTRFASTVAIATPPTSGTATAAADGTILYTSTGGPAATDTFTYTVAGPGGTSTPGTVTLTFADQLRLDNPALAFPAAPPATFYQVVDALPGVSFAQPIAIALQPDSTKRLYVCERMAKIQLVPDVTASTPTKKTFLDLATVIAGRSPAETLEGGANGENGLLGLAFHPNYAVNGYFYAAYTVRIGGGSFYQRISRFSVSAADPDVANPASELILLQQLDEGANHNGGDLHFGADGYLYYAAGDEENPNDFRLNSQRVDKDFFAGIFRLDVDKKPGNLEPTAHAAIPTDAGIARFSVPADNPFVPVSRGGTWDGTLNGVAIADLTKTRMEYWALGLRHAWRMSFDPVTGDLWAGDVGQDSYEEINKITKGGNYGWVYREGFNNTAFSGTPTKPAGFTSIDPVYAYPHPSVAGADAQYAGNSVVGGIVYRGSRFPALYGQYVFCDSVTGHIWKRDPSTGTVTRITGVPGVYGGLVSMGVDPSNQDVLFADYLNGKILRLGTGTATGTFPGTLSATGLFADLTDLSPSPGLLPYQPNLTFWSDFALKQRWFTIPDASKMTWQREGYWTYPAGMVWVKHFDLELTRGNPATKRRLETRVLVKTASSVYGVSYRWNDAQTEATLVPDEGVEFDVNVVENGTPRVQRWGIPGRASCLTCHNPQAGGPLSFNTRQLNRQHTINGYSGNQLALLQAAGYFTNSIEPTNTLPRHVAPDETNYPLETRVRSYLAVNCSYCHRAGGTVAGANWDGSADLTLAQTGLINGTVNNNLGNTANRLIVPGDTTHSVVLNRVAVQNGFSRMPPLGSTELDATGIALLQDWITASLPARETYEQWRLTKFGSGSSPEGDPAADSDGDGRTNADEFTAGTDPLNGSSHLATAFSSDGSTVTVSVAVPANRSAVIETSADLITWTTWDAPANNGLPPPSGLLVVTGTRSSANQFFRVRMTEN